ncbi:hypothetical protein FLM48_10070 [Shewanella sp. Scap07]|uniref:hypothetical protein n=1 Tax=Shewanella sp. Scap07 TaxID=2589987 RepID=UPI0015BED563|nr:hypothetical protein [Shewanella sp. Scap07]QLE85395.1 hypothetical protein FLM48_10070 [Shewanella sp. Scap07]
MISAGIKERWRAAELANIIEPQLASHSVWLSSSNPNYSLDSICRKTAKLIISQYDDIQDLPKGISEPTLIKIFFDAFNIIINKSINQEPINKTDYAIIALARGFAADMDLSHDQELIDHAGLVKSVAKEWEKHIRELNQTRTSRFTV